LAAIGLIVSTVARPLQYAAVSEPKKPWRSPERWAADDARSFFLPFSANGYCEAVSNRRRLQQAEIDVLLAIAVDIAPRLAKETPSAIIH
jgi:hypothetical protein